MKPRPQKYLPPTPMRYDWNFPARIRAKRIKRRAEGFIDIEVLEKDYRYEPARIKPYVYDLVDPKIPLSEFKANVHFLCDLEEEPGMPVEALRKEGPAGKGSLPCLNSNNSIEKFPIEGKPHA